MCICAFRDWFVTLFHIHGCSPLIHTPGNKSGRDWSLIFFCKWSYCKSCVISVATSHVQCANWPLFPPFLLKVGNSWLNNYFLHDWCFWLGPSQLLSLTFCSTSQLFTPLVHSAFSASFRFFPSISLDTFLQNFSLGGWSLLPGFENGPFWRTSTFQACLVIKQVAQFFPRTMAGNLALL